AGPVSARWARTVLAGITADSVGRRIAWALVWRNASFEREHRYHFFAPYPGQASVPDFVRFRADPLILFEDELPDLYQVTPSAASLLGDSRSPFYFLHPSLAARSLRW